MSDRHQTQINLSQIGRKGQLQLQHAKVLVVGLGGLGCPAALYLAAAGVGTIGLADFDTVEASNLHRQILFREEDIGRSKAHVAAEQLKALDPAIQTVVHDHGIDGENAARIIDSYDIVLDCCDNFPTRDQVAAVCRRAKPLVSGMAIGFEGRVFVTTPASASCWRCLHADMPAHAVTQNCARFGVIGALTGVIGSLQALQAIKWIVGAGDLAVGKLLVIDGLGSRFREFTVPADPACPVCRGEAAQPTVRELTVEEVTEASVCQVQLVDVRAADEFARGHIAGAKLVSLGALSERLDELDRTRPVIVYCHSGQRSLAAADVLMRRGFLNVRSLRGGYVAYQRFQNSIDNSKKVAYT